MANTGFAACTVEQLAGTYASQFGPIDCKSVDNALQCCYENVRACNKRLRLELRNNGRELVGEWSERTQSGPVKFMVTPQCDLTSGRWGSGARPTARWMVNQRTSPRPVIAPAGSTASSTPSSAHPQTNGRGKLLFSGAGLAVYTLFTSKWTPNSWCNELSFSVSAEFDRDASFVFAPGFVHNALFEKLLPDLRVEHCPQAAQSITAKVFLKDLYFDPRGGRRSAAEAEKNSTTANAPILTASFNTDFRANPGDRPADASRLNLLYNDNGVHRFRHSDAEVANLVGSADRLLTYWERGGKTPAEYAVILQRQAAVKARYQALEDRYGVALKSYDIVRILGGHSEEIQWLPYDEWYFLLSYIQTTTSICGDKTVGKPYRGQVYVARDGQRVGDSDVILWYSTALRPKVKGRQVGTGWGVYQPDATIKADIEALIEANGCASEPFAVIERFFH